MTNQQCRDLHSLCQHAIDCVRLMSVAHHSAKWQGADIAKNPSFKAYEVLHVHIMAPFMGTDLQYYREQINPNLPWADDHFEERVSGLPLNPGDEWRRWPWGKNADKFRIDPAAVEDMDTLEPVFDHTYQQRYWPKFAGHYTTPPQAQWVNRGIYFPYGDLNDVVEELYHDPGTRQAILPVFFPEDTGYRPGRRKPCSLFYHFQLALRHEKPQLDIVYSIRSCDLIRHFRDDVYLTVRLLIWVLLKLREKNPEYWDTVIPGMFVMLIDNLHIFVNDWHMIQEDKV